MSAISALCISSFLYCVILTKDNPASAYFQLTPRVWEFLIGGIAYLIQTNKSLHVKINNSRSLRSLGIISTAVIFVSLLSVDSDIFPGWIAAIPVIATASIILTGQNGLLNSALSSTALQLIGKLSYSLYLWHWPIYVYIAMSIAVDRPINITEKIIGLVITFAISFASYKWIEQPFRSKNGSRNKNKLFILIWVISILISIISLAYTLKFDALSYRLPNYLKNAEMALADKNPRLGECFLNKQDAAARNYDPKLCKIGLHLSSRVDAILWGDSFADALQPMVDDLLATQKLSGVVSTLSGCLPLNLNAYKEDLNRNQFSYCDKGFNQKTFDFILDNPSLKYVIMSSNWARYDKSVLLNDFSAHVCKLKNMQRIPILIGPIPLPNYDVPRQWGKIELKNRQIINEMLFARSSVQEMEEVFFELISNITTTCGTVPYIMPSNIYCDENNCFSVKNGNALYVDSVHLSNRGASLMKNELETVLLKQKN